MVIILPGYSGPISRVPHSFRVRCGMGGLSFAVANDGCPIHHCFIAMGEIMNP